MPNVSGVLLRGLCPRCNDLMDVTIPVEPQLVELPSGGSKSEFTRSKPAIIPKDPYQITAWCNCGMEHDKRPEGKTGCGAFGNLTVGDH